MTYRAMMSTLETMGTEQNRKVYKRHGAGEVLFGVSFANLEKLKKQIKTDHALAKQLWSSGNADARILATMIADPQAATGAELDAWARDIQYYALAGLFADYVANTPFADTKMREWMSSPHEFTAQAGWILLALATRQESSIPDSYFEERLETIEREIHQSANRVRHSMNSAVIRIALRNPFLKKKALAAAKRIGKVVVDHGETGCKTPDAAEYVKRVEERAAKRKR